MYEKLRNTGDVILTGKKEIFGEKGLCHCLFVHHISHTDWSGIQPSSSPWKVGD